MCLAATLAHQRQPATRQTKSTLLAVAVGAAPRSCTPQQPTTPRGRRDRRRKNVKEIVNSILS